MKMMTQGLDEVSLVSFMYMTLLVSHEGKPTGG